MKNTRTAKKVMMAFLSAGAGLFLAAAVHADTLNFTSTPASSAVAEMSRRYDVSIVFASKVNSSRPVTFSVEDTPDSRVQAMNFLGNALDMDFQKVFVVSKIEPGTSAPEVKIDSNGPIVFQTTKMSAREAIQTIAGVDNALTQISGKITGDVVFPSLRMTAATAAAVVAKQTGTVWRAYYGFFTRGEEPARLKGDVVDHDINGNPITALPLVSFRNKVSTPAPITGGIPSADQPLPSDSLSSTPVPVDVTTGIDTDFGFSPFGPAGFDPYGFGYSNPYGYAGLGYPDPNGGVIYPGTAYTPGAGGTPVTPGVNTPGSFLPGATGITPPNTTTLLPDFPIVGGGASTGIGGY